MEMLSEQERYEAGNIPRDFVPPQLQETIGKVLLENIDDLC